MPPLIRLEIFIRSVSCAAGMMVSPDFLFRTERSWPNPEAPGLRQLDAWSMASRLSFFLWNTTPSVSLLEAAESSELLFEEGLNKQVDRMMSSPRVEDGLRAFFSDMLAFDRFNTLDIDPTFIPSLQKVLRMKLEQTPANNCISFIGPIRLPRYF